MIDQNRPLLLATVVFFGCFSSMTDAAETSADAHEGQHEEINERLDRITELLESLAGQTQVQSPVRADGATTKEISGSLHPGNRKYVPGALADVYQLKGIPDSVVGRVLNGVPPAAPIPRPNSRSFGALLDAPPIFDYHAYLEDEAFVSLSQKPVGMDWQGYLAIESPGLYTVGIELKTIAHDPVGYGHRFPACTMDLVVEEKQILSLFRGSKYYTSTNTAKESALADGVMAGGFDRAVVIVAGTWTDQADLELDAGYYKTSLWVACVGVNPKKIKPAIKIRGPNDRTLRSLTASEFVHRSKD